MLSDLGGQNSSSPSFAISLVVIDKILIKIYIISKPLIIEGGITTNFGINIIGKN